MVCLSCMLGEYCDPGFCTPIDRVVQVGQLVGRKTRRKKVDISYMKTTISMKEEPIIVYIIQYIYI